MCTNVKTLNRNKLSLKVLGDSGCIHTGIDKQLIKEKWIKTEPLFRSFKI